MNKRFVIYLGTVLIFASCHGQPQFGEDNLKTVKIIPLPQVKGRIDHLAFNAEQGLLYIAALGNNSVEVVDLVNGIPVKSVDGIKTPQGIVYLSKQHEIAVASAGTGDCLFINALTYQFIATIHLGDDADNIRYDSTSNKLYVGYGEGGIAVIDPTLHKLDAVIALPGHPEGFQIDANQKKIYVNVPDKHSVSVIDLVSRKIVNQWKPSFNSNYPITINPQKQICFVGFRSPATLAAYDMRNGHQITTAHLSGDVDDLFYDSESDKIFASGGDGTISIFSVSATNTITQVANISTINGARTSLLLPDSKQFILAARANMGKEASIHVFQFSR